MSDNGNSDIWKYRPNVPLAVVVSIIFVLLTGLHGYQLLRTRTWYFIAFWIGGVCESVGYITRIWSAEQHPNYQVAPYAISQVAVLIAPSLLAASMYMELARIIRMCGGEAYSIIKINWLTKLFVIGDIVAFLAQALGAGMLSGADDADSSKRGENIIIIGLAVQILFFVLFVITAVMFHLRVHKNRTAKMDRYPHMPWRKHLINIYTGSVLILIRCAFRLIEYALGEDGYLLSNEWPNYVFDTLLMIVVMAAFAVIHPSEVTALLNGSGRAMRKVILTRHVSLSPNVGGEELMGREPKSSSVDERVSVMNRV